MLNTLTTAARAFDARIGWNRLAIAVSLVVIATAATTLFRTLRNVDVEKIVQALRAAPAGDVAIAAGFVAAAYLTYTFYDVFALRTIGQRHVPYRIAALAGFTSYSIGHNIGATVFVGGAVRFRIYSAWGLTLIDVARMAFVTGLTFWLGNMFLLGLGMLCEPQAASAIDQLPAWLNRVLGMTILASILAYLAWVAGAARVVGRNAWQVILPGARLTIVQIVIGVLDLGSASVAMYVLLPAGTPVELVAVMVTFVLATLLGFASHAPGSIGVFDAAMLMALQQFEKEELIAALLLFRLIYFIIPFVFALAILGARELFISAGRSAEPPADARPPAAPIATEEGKAPPR